MRLERSFGAPTPDAETLIVGRIISPHGVLGEMRVEPLTDDPRRFSQLEYVLVRGEEYEVVSARVQGGRVILKLGGVDAPEDVLPLRREPLRIHREHAAPLEPGAHYHYQLIGLEVVTSQGEPIGELMEVLALPSNDVYVVRGARGEALVPALRDVVREIDVEAARMVVEPLPGLLPWEEE